jgi:hypothetical protein
MIRWHSLVRVPQRLPHRSGTLDVCEEGRERLRSHQPRLLVEVDADRTGRKSHRPPQPSSVNIIRPLSLAEMVAKIAERYAKVGGGVPLG